MRLLIALFLSSTALAWEHASWLNEVEKRLDGDAVVWLRNQINPNQELQSPLPEFSAGCTNCHRGEILDIEEPNLFICISFSVPETIWLSLSQEMKGKRAVFVLRGLPDNSFKLFAQRIAHLKERGMEASVQIHPNLFKEHAIERVPTFIFIDSEKLYKISGATSLEYAGNLTDKLKINGEQE